MSVVTCPYCQTANPVEQEFCLHCGRPLPERLTPQPTPVQRPDEGQGDRERARDAPFEEGGRDESGAEAGSTPKLPGWISELTGNSKREEEPDPLADFLEALDDTGEFDMPDWLLGEPEAAGESAGTEEPSAGEEPAPEEAAPGGEPVPQVPEWLSDVLDEEEAAEIFALTEEDEGPEEEVDWLQALEALDETTAGVVTRALDETIVEPGLQPLAGAAGAGEPAGSEQPEQEPADAPVFEEGRTEPEAGVPGAGVPEAGAQEPGTRPLGPSRELNGVPERLAGSELPGWLAAQLGVEEQAPLQEGPPERPESPGWLEPLEQRDREQDPGKPAAAAELAESREGEEDWLTALADLRLTDEEPAGEQMGLEADEAFPEGVTRDWMVSLKPDDLGTLTGDQMEQAAAASGPLSGLKGVIAIEPIIAEPRGTGRRPRLDVTEEQRQKVSLLQQLSESERKPPPVTIERAPAAIGPAARVAVSVALLALVIVGWLAPDLAGLLPPVHLPPAGAGAAGAFAAVEAARGQTVLMAFDYSPGAAGELDAVARLLAGQLAAGGSNILTVSQTAPGVALADRVMTGIDGLDGRSLGYLPGESVGLRLLSYCLARGGECQGLFPALSDRVELEMLQDVSLIVVLTSERDRLLGWLEQVAPNTDAALVAGVSQGLRPVAAVYAGSRRLAGTIDGLPGAAAYERELLHEEGRASRQLESLTLAQWLVVVIVPVGAIYYGLDALIAARRRKGQGP
jgi:hypothetical protein